MARLFTLAAVAASLVAFIAQESGSSGWWAYALTRASYVLVVLALAAALVSERRPSALVVGAQVLSAVAALAFAAVALAKYYEQSSPLGIVQSAFTWVIEAEVFGVAALAFGLTLARRGTTVAMGAFAAAVALTVGSGIYAVTLKGSFASYIWWLVVGVIAFLAASAAAGLERGGSFSPGPPVASEAVSDPSVE